MSRVQSIFDRKYDVSLAGTPALPIITNGLPRTLVVGIDAVRW